LVNKGITPFVETKQVRIIPEKGFSKRDNGMPYILTLDQGTSSSRCFVFDETGSIVGSAQQEIKQIYPHPGWVEHDPEEIWQSIVNTGRKAIEKAGIRAGDISSVGIANQRESIVVWDRKTGVPLHNVIVWQDRRTAATVARLKNEGYETLIREKTGLLPDAYFSATKIMWMLDNITGARERAKRGELAAGTIDSWLLYKLSGGKCHVTDVTNASRTLLLNIHTGTWDEDLLKIFDIPSSLLPEIKASSVFFADCERTVFGKSIPVSGVAGDQHAALFGQMCIKPGMVKNTYGTGCFLLMNTGASPVRSQHKLLTTLAWQFEGLPLSYALEGSIFIAGAAIQWLRDGLGIIKEVSEVNTLATSVPDSGGVYFVPAFVGLGAPHWDSGARGALLGITRGTTAAHISRATLEGIAFQVADVLRAMEADAGVRIKELRVDGGAAKSDVLMQIQSDILGIPILRPHITETTSLGAAYLAGMGVGMWKDVDFLSEHRKVEKVFEPSMPENQRQEMIANWNKAVECAKGWV